MRDQPSFAGRRFDQAGLEILQADDCVQLMRSQPLGRLVFTEGGLPAVRLVNFVIDGETVVFWSADGDKHRAAARGDVVAFEVDAIDPERHLGWTVTAIGHLSILDTQEADLLAGTLPLRPWAAVHTRQLRMAIESVRGRRQVALAQRPHA